jgi:hypothetical protein
MRRFAGHFPGCKRVGEHTFIYRDVTFQTERSGLLIGCHEGFQLPMNRHLMCEVLHEAGWLHFTQRATVRAVCRAIDSEYLREDRRRERRLEQGMLDALERSTEEALDA